MTAIPGWTEKYVGIPYEDADCWQLARRVMSEQFGLDLPDDVLSAMTFGRKALCRVADPKEGDIVMLRPGGRPHIGVMVSSNRMLHTGVGKNAVIQHLCMDWHHKVSGFYRPKT